MKDNSLKEYLSRYRHHGIGAIVLVWLIHGAKLNSNVVGIDTEDLMHLGPSFYDGWKNTGRQGLVLLKYLTGSAEFNPYFAGLMTVLLFAAAVMAFVMLWDKASGNKDSEGIWAVLAGMLLWIAHPILAEQFYFSLQSAEICIGMLLTAVALWLIQSVQKEGSDRRKGTSYLVSGLLLLISFSVYQIFVVFFIFGTVTVLLLNSLRTEKAALGRKGKAWSVIKEIVPYVGVFLGAFVCNSIVTKLFFSESDYLNSQIKWGQLSLRDCVYSIAVHVRDVLTGQNSIFYSWVYGGLCLMGLILVIILAKKYGFALLFYYCAFMTTPFLMTIVCANVPAVRSQLILPVATGFVAYLDALLLKKCQDKAEQMSGVRVGAVFLVILCVVGGWSQTQLTLRLYYTDACRYAQDEALGRAIIEKLEPMIGEDKTPIVVIGSHKFQGNNACVEGEIIGKSVFEHDVDESPQYYWSTRRVIGFLHTLGYDCEQLPDKNIPYAIEFAEEMDVWPGKHSVEHAGDMIVIKLSE